METNKNSRACFITKNLKFNKENIYAAYAKIKGMVQSKFTLGSFAP